MEKFNLELAKAGHPVCTRDGKPVRIVCFDAKGDYPIVALVYNTDEEFARTFTNEGLYCIGETSDYDLIMASELKENEDEEVRKAIYNCVKWFGFDSCFFKSVSQEKCLAWLEKQGEQKPADKVEQKFKVGDWIVQNGLGKYKIVEVCASWYEVISYNDGIQYSIGFDKENDCHFWTIQDAKVGDVLTTDLVHFIFKSNNDLNCKMYCHYSVTSNKFNISDTAIVDSKYVHPATKEQRDLLFKKVKEAGYEWDVEEKELRKC